MNNKNNALPTGSTHAHRPACLARDMKSTRILTGYALGRSPVPETALTRAVDRLYLAALDQGPGLPPDDWLLQQLDKLNRLATVNAVVCGDLYRALMLGEAVPANVFEHIGLVMPAARE